MATDATGTPTSLGIPKFNTSVDSPSGLGFNAAMDAIDDLLVSAPLSGEIAGIAVGSVPVWDGSAWVKPSGTPDGTKFLRDDGSWADPTGGAGYGTSLPVSPSDGDEYILVDSTTAPTYQWRFRYNASNAGTYKWEFIGGAPVENRVETTQSTTATSATDLATDGPTFTVPRAGIYQAHFGAGGIWNSVQDTNLNLFLYGNGASVGSITQSNAAAAGGGQVYSTSGVLRATLAAASQIIKVRYSVTSGTGSFSKRYLYITPVAVA